MIDITLSVNGEPVTRRIEPRMTLGDFLRDALHLTATHLACEHGVCGACTVLVDGAPVRACIMLAAAAEGSEVRTLEGLQDDAVMGVLREAFSEAHGLQCGYCTPGMLVMARDIVQRGTCASAGQIRQELSGNLCRCTGYQGIVHAVELARDRVRTASHNTTTINQE